MEITMPNWCEVNLDIIVPTKAEAKNIEKAVKANNILNHLCPEPSNMSHDAVNDEKALKLRSQGMHNWYDWRVDNWGTKWELADGDVELYEEPNGTYCVRIWGNTAWAPPITALRYYKERHPSSTVILYYFEPGMDFVGKFDGETDWCYRPSIIVQHKREYEEGLEDIEEELDAMFNLSEQIDDEELEND